MDRFIEAAQTVGCEIVDCPTSARMVEVITGRSTEVVLAGDFMAAYPVETKQLLADGKAQAVRCAEDAAQTVCGVTLACAGLSLTGTLVVASTDETVRFASTLPEEHMVVLKKGAIYPSQRDIVPLLRQLLDHHGAYVAYITGPSRTADIERVLTIGVHGPCRVTILLVSDTLDDNLSGE